MYEVTFHEFEVLTDVGLWVEMKFERRLEINVEFEKVDSERPLNSRKGSRLKDESINFIFFMDIVLLFSIKLLQPASF